MQPNGGPVGIGLFDYALSEQSARVRERGRRGDQARSPSAAGSARFLKLAETPGVYASHPLGGARMADEIGFGVVDDRCEVFGYEGLFCMDSSVIPTSFGVNPSLSISAVCERAAAKLVARAADFDLPAPPPGFKHRPPGVHIGPRVQARPLSAGSAPDCCYRLPVPVDDDRPRSTGPTSERPPEQ